MRTTSTADPAFVKKYASLLPLLREREGEKRFAHTLAVAGECLSLAALFDLSEEKTEELYAAGLLHDITKNCGEAEQRALAGSLGLSLTKEDLASAPVLHALTGAALIRRDFPAFGAAVANAVEAHTTGKPGMTLLDKLLFLADTIEPTRKQTVCRAARERFYRALESASDRPALLDRTILELLESTKAHLAEEGFPIHPLTQQTIDWLKQSRMELQERK